MPRPFPTPAAARCASTGAVPRPFRRSPGAARRPPTAAAPTRPPPARSTATRSSGPRSRCAARRTATAAADPSGFDCSGFTQYVFAQHGVALPRDGARAVRAGNDRRRRASSSPATWCSSRRPRPGASHVGIAIGGDEFVHAPSSTRRGARRAPQLELLVDALRRRARVALTSAADGDGYAALNWPLRIEPPRRVVA